MRFEEVVRVTKRAVLNNINESVRVIANRVLFELMKYCVENYVISNEPALVELVGIMFDTGLFERVETFAVGYRGGHKLLTTIGMVGSRAAIIVGWPGEWYAIILKFCRG